MCSIGSHEKEQKYVNDKVSGGGIIPMPSN